MEIPKKIREQLDKLYEADDNQDYIVGLQNQYIPKKSSVFVIRHYHHIDRNRNNNELWNLVPLTYNQHIIEVHTKNNQEVKGLIYDFMVERFPEHEEHYKKYLKEETNESKRNV